MLAPSKPFPQGQLPSYQCSPSFEPSAAAVIIAGIPIATVASAMARASIMTIPLDATSSSSLIGSLRNRFANQHLPHACFERISPQRVLVSGLVATIGRAFRSLWRESDRGEPLTGKGEKRPA